MGNVIPMRPGGKKPDAEDDGYDGLVCRCGSAWFLAKVALGPLTGEGRSVIGHATDVACVVCGEIASTSG